MGITWDAPGERTYETGLDRGVLYLPDDTAVPWNGLTSVSEKIGTKTNAVYFDGRKITDLSTMEAYAGVVKAITYPDEVIELEGNGRVTAGLYFGDQRPQVFGLSYRTRIGNDLEGDEAGHKIHLLYNVTAVPNDKTFDTVSDDVNPVEFEWNITAIPEDSPGFRPTAHIIIDTRNTTPELLASLELMLYGDEFVSPAIVPPADLVGLMYAEYKYLILDNGNGTWTAITPEEDLITVVDGEFTMLDTDATYLTPDLYEISTSYA